MLFYSCDGGSILVLFTPALCGTVSCLLRAAHLQLHSPVLVNVLLLLLQQLELVLQLRQLHQLAVHHLHLFFQLVRNSSQLITGHSGGIQRLPVCRDISTRLQQLQQQAGLS